MAKQPRVGNEDPVEGSRDVVDRELEKDKRDKQRAETGSRGDPRSLERKEEGGGPA
jgi:hypothetical protein